MQYLLELRRRILFCLISTFLLFSLLCFIANPLYQYFAYPLLHTLPSGHLIAIKLTSPFIVPIKFVFLISIFLLAPLFLYHLWAFVSPALYQQEKNLIWFLLAPSVLLFYSGVLFAYFIVLPIMFQFFIKTTPLHVELLPDITEYLSFVWQILFAFGVAFEVPIVVVALVSFSIVSLEQLRSARRYMVVLAFAIAMVVTPPDVLSQILLAIPLWLLYELGLWIATYLPAIRKSSSIRAKHE